MAVKPGYKQTEVGVLPESWRAAWLHRCVRSNAPICYGILMPGDHYDQGVPVIKVRDILAGRIDESNLLLTHPSIDEAYKRSRLCSGDLLITIRGTTGRVALVQKELHGANITQDTARVRISSAESEVFVYYALQSQAVQQQVALHTIGQAVKGINIRDVKELTIPLPDGLPEQHAIAAVLSDADALIDSLQQLIAKKCQIKQGATQELLSGAKRLPGFEKVPGRKQTEAGLIPEDWEVQSLDAISMVTSGKRLPVGRSLTDQHTQHPYIRVTDMRPGTVSLSDIKFVPEDVFPSIKRYRIFKEDIFISVAGTLGVVGKIPPELDGANLTENADRITNIVCSRDYLLHVLMSPPIQNTIESLQTIGAQPKLALTRIRQFAIPLPPTKVEQEAIAAILSDMDTAIAALEENLAKARMIKQGMMQELLTGKVRLV